MSDQFNYVQTQPFTLAGAGCSVGATSITLTSFKQIDGTTNLTMSNFGTLGFATIEPGNGTNEEQICFTGVVQNANGTATLTGVSTVLFVSPYTKTSGTAKAHVGGTTLVISNTAGFYDELTSKDDDETINGLYTFAQFPQKSGSTTPTIAAELASKAYVDSVAGGIAITNQLIVAGTAGENLTAGNVVYKKASDGKWYISKANTTNTFQQLELGIAQATVSTNAAVNVLLRGLDSNQSGLVAGTSYYVTDAGGAPSSTPGTNTVFVGYGQSATTLIVDFRSIDIPYHNEKLALVGSSGTPSATNVYITQADVSSAVVAGKIVRSFTQAGTAVLPGYNAINLISINIPALYASGQAAGDIIVKNNGKGWTRIPSSVGKVAIGTIVAPGLAFQNVPKYNNGVSSRAGDAANGSQTIAHGLGITPRKVRIICRKLIGANSVTAFSDGSFNTTNNTTSCVYISNVTAGNAGTDTTNILYVDDGSTTGHQVATCSVDSTNITLSWTKTSSPSSNTIYIMFEVEA